MMTILHIEHPIRDFDSWKKAFESDPAGREKGGVRRYQVLRPIDDPNYVMIDLDFDSSRAAEAFLATMSEVWRSPAAARALSGTPQTRIIEVVESKEY
jgi:quinol monooxygenase YgiN